MSEAAHRINQPSGVYFGRVEILKIMASDGFRNLAMDKTEESLLIEEADHSMENPNLVRFVVGDNSGKRGCALTLRVWLVGLMLTAVLSAFSQVSLMRTLPVQLQPLISLIIAYPLGTACASLLPKRVVKVLGLQVNLNPGPFSLREHALVMLMASSANAPSAGLVSEVVREFIFGQSRSRGAGIMSGLGSVLVGLGMGGLVSRLVVFPDEMVWPHSLMAVALTKALHERRYFPSASRIKFFWMVAAGAFAYQFLPGLLFAALSSISLLCWISPRSAVLNQLGSGLQGLGLGAISLDWSLVISYMPSPLIYPFYAAANLFAGFVLFMWILVPWGYYSNLWDTQQLPIQSFKLYDIRGLPYNTEAIQSNGVLNEAAYHAQGPLRMSWLFFLSYFFGIAAVSAAVTHVALYHGVELVTHVKAWIAGIPERRQQSATLTSDVPSLWYVGILLVGFVTGVVGVALTEVRATVAWYVLLVAITFGLVLVVPVAWIMGLTSHNVSIHILAELVSGILWPGNGAAMVYFRAYSYFALFAACSFCSDLKYGQYMKIPQRQVLLVQVIGNVLSSVIHSEVTYGLLNRVPGMFLHLHLGDGGANPPILPHIHLSPHRLCHPGGFPTAAPLFALHLRFPDTLFAYINIPIVLSAVVFSPVTPSVQFITWFIVAVIFNHVVYRRFQSWWLRKNLLLAAGLDTGTFLATLIVAVVISSDLRPQWWGNDPAGGCPLAGRPLRPSAAAEALLAKMAQPCPAAYRYLLIRFDGAIQLGCFAWRSPTSSRYRAGPD
ncbi:hypothetical protein L0F63_000062 [Massospora cicadina]|nr:hypothetical protein L0F63_000062 [Massospora cicadina]